MSNPKILTRVGIAAIVLFVAIYAVELFQHGGPPVTIKWILHWPSVITLALWPVLVAAYVWLARQEEKVVGDEFGDAYLEYAQKTPRFLPRVWSARASRQ